MLTPKYRRAGFICPQPNMYKLVFLSLTLFLVSCNNLFFYPVDKYFYNPKSAGLNPEIVSFVTEDGVELTGWLFAAFDQPAKGTVIQFHGNAQNMSTHFLLLSWMSDLGYNFFCFDYRGYGRSGGKPTFKGLQQDAAAAYRYILNRNDFNDIDVILYGQSLGGAVLLKALESFPKRERIKAVVVEGAFLSYQEIARRKLADLWITWPVQHLAYILVSGDYDATAAVKKVSPIPLLIIHGTSDQIVPHRFGEEIYELALEPKYFWTIDSNEHIDAMSAENSAVRKRFIQFLNRLDNKN